MSKVRVFRVPTLNDGYADFNHLFALQKALLDSSDDIELDFTGCRFLRQNAVAILGGLAEQLQYRGLAMRFRLDTLQDDVRRNLERNGLLEFLGVSCVRNAGFTIPFRHDPTKDADGIITYLEQAWLGKGWVNVSQALRERIVGCMWEIYDNAFGHADSPEGVFSCGQYYPNMKRLKLTVVDFGVGIPARVKGFVSLDKPQETLSPKMCMAWAFAKGNSTRTSGASAGVGLDILREFVQLNSGKLEVFSHAGYTRVSKESEFHGSRELAFAGTLLNITLVCDESFYCLDSETGDEDYF